MKVIGLTGSIGMGKSETARMFAKLGMTVLDSDQVVHELYARDGRAVEPVSRAFPASRVADIIDRQKLANLVLDNPEALKKLEAIVHPLVQETQQAFIQKMQAQNKKFVILEIPLLFETGAQKRLDKTILVSASPGQQRQCVLARPNMDEDKFNYILARQMPDEEKRKKADIIIDTSADLETTFRQVKKIVSDLNRSGE
jgi:dephospho-CoA kinase